MQKLYSMTIGCEKRPRGPQKAGAQLLALYSTLHFFAEPLAAGKVFFFARNISFLGVARVGKMASKRISSYSSHATCSNT